MNKSNVGNAAQLVAVIVSAMVLTAQATIRYCAPEPTGNDSNDGLSADTPKTFDGAVAKLSNGDELRVMTGTYNLASDNVGSHRFTFGGPLSFRGWDKDKNADADREDVVIDLEGKNGLFYSVRGLEVYNLTIQNAHARTYGGGAICLNQNSSYFDEKVVVSNCVFKSNYAYVHAGGALYVYRPATIVDCHFEGNTNDTFGGALFINQSVAVRGCTFVGNRGTSGGAVYGDSHGDLTDCVFSNNVANVDGGAVYGVHSLRDCVIVSNCAAGSGGGFAWSGSGVRTLVGCDISNNVQRANGNWACGGGGLYCATANCRISLTNCVISYNRSACSGGAVLMRYGSLFEAFGCTFEGNYADSRVNTGNAQNGTGSALWFYAAQADSTNRFEHCTFRNNSVRAGAGSTGVSVMSDAKALVMRGCAISSETADAGTVYNFSSAAADISGLTVCGVTNSAKLGYIFYAGAGSSVRDSVVRNVKGGRPGITLAGSIGKTNVFQRCTFANNDSTKSALIEAGSAFLAVEDCTFRDNVLADGFAATSGGIAIMAGGSVAIDRCSFVNNTNSVQTGANGGAIYLYATSASDAGSHIRNCLFYGNACGWHANRFASAICLHSGTTSKIPIENCTFVNNLLKAPVQCYGGSSWADKNLINCVFAGNAANQLSDNMDHCWQGTLADAQFADAASGDYRPALGSPLVDQGLDADWMVGARDLQNSRKVPRIIGSAVDIGCYEFRPTPGMMMIFR